MLILKSGISTISCCVFIIAQSWFSDAEKAKLIAKLLKITVFEDCDAVSTASYTTSYVDPSCIYKGRTLYSVKYWDSSWANSLLVASSNSIGKSSVLMNINGSLKLMSNVSGYSLLETNRASLKSIWIRSSRVVISSTDH